MDVVPTLSAGHTGETGLGWMGGRIGLSVLAPLPVFFLSFGLISLSPRSSREHRLKGLAETTMLDVVQLWLVLLVTA